MDTKFNKYLCLIFIILFIGCASNSGYKIKTFFFDGVPDPNQKKEEIVEIIRDTTNVIIKDSAFYSKRIYNQTITTGSAHPPYRDKKCYECHEQISKKKLNMPVQELCFKCHKESIENVSYKHGPFISGNCTICHNPHKSNEHKNLLYSENQNLCLQCHQNKDVLATNFHATIGEQNCTECHSPHGGSNKMFLRKNSCSLCHQTITENKQNLHGPIAAGECSTCHESHDSKKEKLLVNTGTALCFNCHNTTDVLTKPYHKKVSKQDCISCHDPHGSNQSFLLITPEP